MTDIPANGAEATNGNPGHSTLPSDRMTAEEQAAVDSMRNRGFAVVVFTADEVANASSSHLEDILVERGNNFIDFFADSETASADA